MRTLDCLDFDDNGSGSAALWIIPADGVPVEVVAGYQMAYADWDALRDEVARLNALDDELRDERGRRIAAEGVLETVTGRLTSVLRERDRLWRALTRSDIR